MQYEKEEKNMCKVSEYPGLYSKANESLRKEGLNPTMPGYEFLKRGIVIYKIEHNLSKEEFFRQVREGMLVPVNRNTHFSDSEKCDDVEQWMLESIRSAGIRVELMEYIKQLAEELS